MDLDDEIRSKKGVVTCLRDMGDGTSCIFFDDVTSASERASEPWTFQRFYTSSPALANGDLDSLQLSAGQLEQIGLSLIARLLALNGRVVVYSFVGADRTITAVIRSHG